MAVGDEGRGCEQCGSRASAGRLCEEPASDDGEPRSAWYCEACWRAWEAPRSGAALALPPELSSALWLASQTTTAVSLGAWCGVKMAMRAIGASGETLPFDWTRVSMEGLLELLRADFAGFLDYTYACDGPHSRHFVKQGSHSFFHDDLDQEADREKYLRRVGRFRELRMLAESRAARAAWPAWGATAATGPSSTSSPSCGSSCTEDVEVVDCVLPAAKAPAWKAPLLFIRALNTTLELSSVRDLFLQLARRFGPRGVFLLLLLDHQPADQFIFFTDLPGLFLCTISKSHCHRAEYDIEHQPYVTAYHEPIAAGLWHVNSGHRPQPHVEIADINVLLDPGGGGLIRHVSLGEDLAASMSYDPQLPGGGALACAGGEGPEAAEGGLLEEMARSHFERCRELGMAPQLPASCPPAAARLLARALGPREELWERVS